MTTTRIKEAIKLALPKGQGYSIRWDPVASSKLRILRILTPAWKNQPRWKRVAKVQGILNHELAPHELRNIFRVSVLTPDEFKKLKPYIAITKLANGTRHR